MKANQASDVDVGQAVSVRHAEGLVVTHPGTDPHQALTGGGTEARVDEGHAPIVARRGVILDPSGRGVHRHVGVVEPVIAEVVPHDVAEPPEADHEVADAMGGVDLHDVPEDRLVADRDHGLRAAAGLLPQPCALATGEDDCLHRRSIVAQTRSVGQTRTRPSR